MNKYEINMDEKNKNCYVKIEGDLCADDCAILRTALKDKVASTDRIAELVVDIAKVNMIDSAGIGLLIALHNSLQKKNGKLKLCEVGEPIYQFLTTLRLHSHFEICPADSSKES